MEWDHHYIDTKKGESLPCHISSIPSLPKSPHLSHRLHDASYLTHADHMHIEKDIIIEKVAWKKIITAKNSHH